MTRTSYLSTNLKFETRREAPDNGQNYNMCIFANKCIATVLLA